MKPLDCKRFRLFWTEIFPSFFLPVCPKAVKNPAAAPEKSRKNEMAYRGAGSVGFVEQDSTEVPKSAYLRFCPPAGILLGSAFPKPYFVLADCISFACATTRKLIHFVARPLPTQPASLSLCGDPI